MMSLWDALRMNMMISYQELVRTFPKRSGFFVLKTVITGKTSHVLRAYKAIKAEASR